MADTTTFFAELSERGYDPRLERTTGRIRIELSDGDRTEPWIVTIARGTVLVANTDGDADCVVRTDRATFDDLAAGRANAMASVLRGRLSTEGDPSLLIRFSRLFPAPTAQPVVASDRSVGRRRS